MHLGFFNNSVQLLLPGVLAHVVQQLTHSGSKAALGISADNYFLIIKYSVKIEGFSSCFHTEHIWDFGFPIFLITEIGIASWLTNRAEGSSNRHGTVVTYVWAPHRKLLSLTSCIALRWTVQRVLPHHESSLLYSAVRYLVLHWALFGITMLFLLVSSYFFMCVCVLCVVFFSRWITESDSRSILALWTLELSRDWEAYEEVLSGKTVLSKDTKEEGKGERKRKAETLTNHGRYLSSS